MFQTFRLLHGKANQVTSFLSLISPTLGTRFVTSQVLHKYLTVQLIKN